MDEVEALVDAERISWSATDKRMEEIASEIQEDPAISTALHNTEEGWPRYIAYVETGLKDLYAIRGELREHQALLIRSRL